MREGFYSLPFPGWSLFLAESSLCLPVGSHLGTGRGIVRVPGYGHGQGGVLPGEVSLG